MSNFCGRRFQKDVSVSNSVSPKGTQELLVPLSLFRYLVCVSISCAVSVTFPGRSDCGSATCARSQPCTVPVLPDLCRRGMAVTMDGHKTIPDGAVETYTVLNTIPIGGGFAASEFGPLICQ